MSGQVVLMSALLQQQSVSLLCSPELTLRSPQTSLAVRSDGVREEIVCIIDTDHLPLMDLWMDVSLYSDEDIVQGTQATHFLTLYVSYCFSHLPVPPSQSLFLSVIVLQLSSSQILNMGPV